MATIIERVTRVEEHNEGTDHRLDRIEGGVDGLRAEVAELRREFRAYFLALLGFMFTLLAIMIGGFITMANMILRIAGG